MFGEQRAVQSDFGTRVCARACVRACRRCLWSSRCRPEWKVLKAEFRLFSVGRRAPLEI